jgi:Mitochondrial carrier protein
VTPPVDDDADKTVTRGVTPYLVENIIPRVLTMKLLSVFAALLTVLGNARVGSASSAGASALHALRAIDYRFFVAGGTCAAISHGITTPIDVVKTRMQASPKVSFAAVSIVLDVSFVKKCMASVCVWVAPKLTRSVGLFRLTTRECSRRQSIL